MTVLVAMPYWRCAPWVGRAVRSVLAQTYRDLVCLVVGDGEEPPLAGIHDDRLVVTSYPVNRGAYFAQDVAVWASPFELYMPVAADDWLDRDHVERLLEQGGDLACGALWSHGDSPAYCGPDHDDHAACRGRLVHKSYEVGLYGVARYREIGGHNPAERIGQDTLTLRLMRLVAPVGASAVPTYNRRFRDGSLCTDPATGAGSPARTAMRLRNRKVLAECERIARRTRDRRARAAAIRAYREARYPRALRAELTERVAATRRLLGEAVAA